MTVDLMPRGFQLLPQLMAADQRKAVVDGLSSLPPGSAGRRDLLEQPWCRELARWLRSRPELQPWLSDGQVAVQCTLFEKSADRNWLVTPHQDLAIPVAQRVEHAALKGWSIKDGQHFVLAPAELLEGLTALRLHLDDATAADGGLRFVPGSHRSGVLTDADALSWRERAGEVVADARAGDVLLMSPLVLHASSKASAEGRRRVLHFLFGPSELPFGLQWRRAA